MTRDTMPPSTGEAESLETFEAMIRAQGEEMARLENIASLMSIDVDCPAE